jgi:phage-related protein
MLFSLKPVTWIGSSKRDLSTCTPAVRRVAGFELQQVQSSIDPTDWKPMTTIGPGAREIRVHVDGELRVFYVATFPEAVYVLHVFEKKTQKTSARDLALGQTRYRSMLEGRRGK